MFFVTGKSVVAKSIIIADQLNIPICTVEKPCGHASYIFKFEIIPTHNLNKTPRKIIYTLSHCAK